MATLFEGIGMTSSLVTLFLSILRLGCLHNQSDSKGLSKPLGRPRGNWPPGLRRCASRNLDAPDCEMC